MKLLLFVTTKKRYTAFFSIFWQLSIRSND